MEAMIQLSFVHSQRNGSFYLMCELLVVVIVMIVACLDQLHVAVIDVIGPSIITPDVVKCFIGCPFVLGGEEQARQQPLPQDGGRNK